MLMKPYHAESPVELLESPEIISNIHIIPIPKNSFVYVKNLKAKIEF